MRKQHKNTKKQRKANFDAACKASYDSKTGLGRMKRYIRRARKESLSNE